MVARRAPRTSTRVSYRRILATSVSCQEGHPVGGNGQQPGCLAADTTPRGTAFSRRFNRTLELLSLPDPRRAVRHSCWLPVVYQEVMLVGGQCASAVVVDVSRLGLCVIGRHWLPPASFLAVRLPGPVQPPEPLLVKLVRAQPLDLEGCLLGGVWQRPLAPAQLHALLEIPPAPSGH